MLEFLLLFLSFIGGAFILALAGFSILYLCGLLSGFGISPYADDEPLRKLGDATEEEKT